MPEPLSVPLVTAGCIGSRRPIHGCTSGLTGQIPVSSVLRGEEIGLVRPYLVAHERREQQRRRARRRVVRLAVYGIDIDTELVGAAEVRAW
ncbi:hypothetical protein ABZ865_12325 [Streptomyces sp. NPDC047085]|uniref:hypothetical protein n=1 Tax=Streptomyces sp. NPDC047085 TaxID=3155140 RepID=UPI00340EFA1C